MVFKNSHQNFSQQLILYLLFLFVYESHAMDQAIMLQPQVVVWNLFFIHARDILPYDDEHSFAQTSRNNCALIYEIQGKRKECISNTITKHGIEFKDNAQFVYHRSWRVFGAIDITTQESDNQMTSNTLRMFSCTLHGNEPIIPKIAVWDNFKAKLSHNPSPFFNKNNELCFHGFTRKVYLDPSCVQYSDPVRHTVIWQGIVEYTISEQLPCELLSFRQDIEPLHIQLVEFLNFPVLLKNILESDGATINVFENFSFSRYKSYDINKVWLSDNYKDFQEIPDGRPAITSFNDLIRTIKNILACRYKQQKE